MLLKVYDDEQSGTSSHNIPQCLTPEALVGEGFGDSHCEIFQKILCGSGE